MIMDNQKQYFNNVLTYEELLEWLNSGDLQFEYKGKGYNITFTTKPCINVISEDYETCCKTNIEFKTYEELLNNYRFDDGVKLIDAFKTEDIQPY